jgi:hypothetical protein
VESNLSSLVESNLSQSRAAGSRVNERAGGAINSAPMALNGTRFKPAPAPGAATRRTARSSPARLR